MATRRAARVTHLVDTLTLAKASGLSTSMIRKLVHEGVLTPLLRERRREHRARGRPPLWFDYDTAMAVLDARSTRCDSPP